MRSSLQTTNPTFNGTIGRGPFVLVVSINIAGEEMLSQHRFFTALGRENMKQILLDFSFVVEDEYEEKVEICETLS